MLVVLAIGVHETPPLVENSHPFTFPVLPTNVNVPLFDPLQAGDVPPVIVPPTDEGLTFATIVPTALIQVAAVTVTLAV